jgi:hypothetical protein
LNLFALRHSIPAIDKACVASFSYVIGRRVTSYHISVIEIPVSVREMRGRRVATVGQQRLYIGPIIIQVSGTGYLRSVQSDATLTEERVKEIICPGRKIRVIQSGPIGFFQPTLYEQLDVQVYVAARIVRYDEF